MRFWHSSKGQKLAHNSEFAFTMSMCHELHYYDFFGVSYDGGYFHCKICRADFKLEKAFDHTSSRTHRELLKQEFERLDTGAYITATFRKSLAEIEKKGIKSIALVFSNGDIIFWPTVNSSQTANAAFQANYCPSTRWKREFRYWNLQPGRLPVSIDWMRWKERAASSFSQTG